MPQKGDCRGSRILIKSLSVLQLISVCLQVLSIYWKASQVLVHRVELLLASISLVLASSFCYR